MGDYTVKKIEDMEAVFRGAFKRARAELGYAPRDLETALRETYRSSSSSSSSSSDSNSSE